MMTVDQIIALAGGAPEIARQSVNLAAADKTGAIREVKVKAVYKWADIGINERHWPLVMKLVDVTADDLHKANMAVRIGIRPRRGGSGSSGRSDRKPRRSGSRAAARSIDDVVAA